MFDVPLKQRQPWVDWPIIVAVLGLMVIGALFIASATLARDEAANVSWFRQEHFKQVLWYGVGVMLAVGACVLDYRRLARWAMVAYWLNLVLLVLVLVPHVGTTHGWGARRWIDFGPFQFQPSEFAKLAFILMLANYLSRPPSELQQVGLFLKSLGMAILPFLLILKEPDLGSALVFLPVGLVMMFVAGVPARRLWQFLGALGLIAALLVADVLFAPPNWPKPKVEPYQRRRLMVYFGVDFVPPQATEAERQRALKEYRDASHNVEQALISVGSGGLTGKGWRQGTQNALGYLPRAVAHNDFIFSVIAEESGFVGSVIVLTLYSVILFSGIKIAGQARDRLGRLLAVGVVTLLFSHVFINIGMNIRLMPVTGIPLPLLSYGGTSVLCSLVAIGLLQNVYLYRRR
jgi:rod shape determining protein RodA